MHPRPTLASRVRAGIAVIAVGSALSGCTGSEARRGGSRPSTPRGALTVSAASSLTGAFSQIAKGFSARYPNVRVSFNFGPSSTLATQLTQGAPAGVFAAADTATMQRVVDDNLVIAAPTVFAANRLVIATKPGNPHHVKSLADLADLGTVALCGADVPCGKYAAQVLQSAGVTLAESEITRGADAKATLAAVRTGDADAAIVYATDAKSAGAAVTAVGIPDHDDVIVSYPIAALTRGDNAPAATAFVRWVTSTSGQATLRRFGFLPGR